MKLTLAWWLLSLARVLVRIGRRLCGVETCLVLSVDAAGHRFELLGRGSTEDAQKTMRANLSVLEAIEVAKVNRTLAKMEEGTKS